MEDTVIKKINPAAIGRVVQSVSGRDTGKFFVIERILEHGYVEIADGRYHKLNNPKKKKTKHLFLTDEVLRAIADKLTRGSKVFDSELSSALKGYYNEPEVF